MPVVVAMYTKLPSKCRSLFDTASHAAPLTSVLSLVIVLSISLESSAALKCP
jgi:hypothetical protein